MSDSCAGECCAVFPLASADRMRAGTSTDVEAPFILDMIVPLSPDEAAARYVQLGYGPIPELLEGRVDLYTCRHWSEETRLCGVYEQRPVMCRDYPYNHPCERGCGFCSPPEVVEKWDGYARAGTVD